MEKFFEHISNVLIKKFWTNLFVKNHGKIFYGFGLFKLVEEYKEHFFKGCDHHSPRPTDWKCTVGWYEEQEKDPEFQKVIKRFFEGLSNQSKGKNSRHDEKKQLYS